MIHIYLFLGVYVLFYDTYKLVSGHFKRTQ